MNTSEEMDIEIEYSKPWVKRSNFRPAPGKNEALEEILFEVESCIFNPSNTRRVKYNLSKEEKLCLNDLSKWNMDSKNLRMFRIQYKGSRLVVELKERYERKMLDYLEDVSIFQDNDEDQCQENEKKVSDWVRKWENQEQLGGEEAEWILSSETRPAKACANIKTHKEEWPYRYIKSCNQTAIEKLARWVEYRLKSLSRQHPTYLRDIKHFLYFLEKLNEEQGPYKMNEITMLCRNVSNFYPSFDTKMFGFRQTTVVDQEIQLSIS